MSFLSKKSWHARSTKNVAKVWKAEQDDQEAKRKKEQRLKELQEEHEHEALLQLQAKAAGIPLKERRIEWMYQQPTSALPDEQDSEAYLTGKRSIEMPKENLVKGVQETPGSLFLKADTMGPSDLDIRMRMRDDPLFTMKQREAEYLKQTTAVSLKMKSLQKGDNINDDHHHRHRSHREDNYHHQRQYHSSKRNKNEDHLVEVRRGEKIDIDNRSRHSPWPNHSSRDAHCETSPSDHDRDGRIYRHTERDGRRYRGFQNERGLRHEDTRYHPHSQIERKPPLNENDLESKRLEKLRVLEEMRQNAQLVQDSRNSWLDKISHASQEEKSTTVQNQSQDWQPQFISDIGKSVFKDVKLGSLDNRLKSKQFYIQADHED